MPNVLCGVPVAIHDHEQNAENCESSDVHIPTDNQGDALPSCFTGISYL